MFAAALLSVLSLAIVAHSQIITPPSAVQCEPVLLSWTADNNPPYFISVLPGGQVSAAAIENIGTFTNTSVTWIVDLPAGTNITLQLRDGAGQPVYSAPFLIQTGPDSSCIGTNAGYVGGAGLPAKSSGSASASGASSASGSSASATNTASSSSVSATSASSTASSASSVSSASTTSTHTTSTSSTTSASRTSSASAAATTSPNAAMGLATVDWRMAGIAGLISALFFA